MDDLYKLECLSDIKRHGPSHGPDDEQGVVVAGDMVVVATIHTISAKLSQDTCYMLMQPAIDPVRDGFLQ